ncbi:MAG: hypothetical protein AB1689_21520 [Thermodesulfobacteriota bacterium]
MSKHVLAIALAALAATAPSSAGAVDALLPGKRLVIDSHADQEKRNRIVLTARSADLAISPPGSAGDPTCEGAGGGGARLTFTSAATGESHTTELPCQNWTGRKTGSWRYADRQLDDGTCSVVQIRSTRTIRAVCLGRGPTVLDFDLAAGERQDPIDVTLELGTGPDRYCLRFGGVVKHDGSNGKKFFARDSGAPTACADPPPS